ncbi:LysR family transcriptional regulator [Galactobacter sp.]|uniref:LysR family transcriptional regulator n=1 Tax=Galactobacter sp. TaxID=2676125 RepID=UPI0025C2F198|nr:LysR family transcriptional regulator [Galactobacter sp.]
MDLNLLRTFLAVFDHGSVTAAADELRLAQPTVSHALGRLRKIVGDPLFVRTGSRLVPTSRSVELAPVVRRDLASLDEVLSADRVFDPVTTQRRFTIALSDVGETSFLAPIMRLLNGEAPGASLLAVPTDVDEVAGWLRRGEVDAAVASIPLDVDGSSTILANERYVAMLPSDLVLAGPTLTAADLAGHPRAVVSKAAGHALIEETVRELGMTTEAVVNVRHFSVLPQLVQGAGIIGFAPAQMAQTVASVWGLRLAELPDPSPRFDVNLFWDEATSKDNRARRWFIDLVRRALAGLSTPDWPVS